MSTIYEIARMVGVSTATVSRALSSRGYVRKDLKERILQVAREMDYMPNSFARGLVTKQSHILGLIMPDICNPFFPAVARGVEDVASENGYNVVLCNTDGSRAKENDYISVLRSQQTDGVIFTTSQVSSRHVKALIEAGIPVVLADRRLDIECDIVVVDNVEGAYQMTRHLLEMGHTRIGIITGPMGVATSAERIEGHRRALVEAGVEICDDLVMEGDYRQPSGHERALEFLRMPSPPTAVFACNDLMAVGALSAIEEAGLMVPNDVAVVGFDDIAIASAVKPRLSTMAQPMYEIGVIASRMLIGRIKSPTKPYQTVVLQPQLVIRESSIMRARTS